MTAPRERALELLERHITNGREAGADAGVTAMECLVALEGIGYRPTAAVAANWRMQGSGGSGLPSAEETRADLEAVRKQCAVSPTRVHPADPPRGEVA